MSPDNAPELLLYGPARSRLETAPWAPERRLQLLAVLALADGHWVTRDRLAALLWPEHGQAEARRNLRHVIFKARERVPSLEANVQALRWAVSTDLQAFDRALAAGQVEPALVLRRGTVLEGLDDPANETFAGWLAEQRRAYDQRWRDAAIAHLPTLADAAARATLGRLLLRLDPYDEGAVAAWMRTELAHGDRAAAGRVLAEYRERIAEELGVEPRRDLRALFEDRGGAVASSGLVSAFPGGPGAFVGRRAELAQITAWLADPSARLLTLQGTGGSGKSRLAAEVLRLAGERLGTARHWFDLQFLHDDDDVPSRLAALLGAAGAGDGAQRIARHVGARPTLVVLDNAEHLPALGAVARTLLTAAPGLRLLATSRRRIQVADEAVLGIGGLPVPDTDSRDPEAAVAFDAVKLFVHRATAVQRSFDPVVHLPAIIDIVDAVGGLPLAIELAAAWVRLLPPDEIARELRDAPERLEHDLSTLGEPARPEHRSLGLVIQRTWELLAPGERAALAALSVFRGGCTAAAARAVAEVSLPVLSALVERGLVTSDSDGRFGLHPLVAASAAARLARDREAEVQLKRRHAEHYTSQLEGLAPQVRVDHRAVVAGVEAEFANAQAAWRRALAERDAAAVQRMLPAWRALFDVQARFSEGVAHLLPVLQWPTLDAALAQAVAEVRNVLSMLLYRSGDLARSRAVAESGIALAEYVGARRALVGCLSSVGSCLSLGGRWDEAVPYFERALALARDDGERGEMAASYTNLGICAKKAGRFEEAMSLYAQALAIDRELGHHEAVVRRLVNIGNVHLERSEWAEALAVLREGMALAQRHAVRSMWPYFESSIGLSLYELGRIDDAEPHLRRALELARASETHVIVSTARHMLARVLSRRGQAAQAIELLQQSASDDLAAGSRTEVIDAVLYFGEWLRDRGDVVSAASLWTLVAAHPQTEAGVAASAGQWMAALPLDAEARAAAANAAPTLDEAVERLLAQRVD